MRHLRGQLRWWLWEQDLLGQDLLGQEAVRVHVCGWPGQQRFAESPLPRAEKRPFLRCDNSIPLEVCLGESLFN